MKLSEIFGKKPKPFDLELRFHKEANLYGEHGQIVVSHVRQGLVEKPVRFVFVGCTTPPKLDRIAFNYIWEEARAQGYVPHEIRSYGMSNEINTAPAVNTAVVE
jgi:hypothetical protein